MANGWAPDGAVQEQIDDSVKDALASALARMPSGAGLAECEECGEPIPEARRRALPGAHWHVGGAAELVKRAASKVLAGWGRTDQVLPDL